jgi:hypothetical protein
MVAVPLDGRITSQAVLSAPLTGGEVMEIVSPGNAAHGNTYQVSTAVLAAFAAAFSSLNTETITAGATSGSPFNVETTDTRILFNKTIGSASYALLPLAASMVYSQPVLFKDLKGDADTNPISITFTAGELCDGLSAVEITTSYGWVTINPVVGGGAWYMTS